MSRFDLASASVMFGRRLPARWVLALQCQNLVPGEVEVRVRRLADHAQRALAEIARSGARHGGLAGLQRRQAPLQLIDPLGQGRELLPQRQGFEGFDNV